MMAILTEKQNSSSDESRYNRSFSSEIFIDSTEFTQVLDTAYNVGDLRNLGVQVPEESKATWERYFELSDAHDGKFSAVVAAADQLGLVDKESNFYKEWNQDRIYNETYHVRLKWAESWSDGPQLPFNETELVEYRTFAEELYKQNKAFYDLHQESKSKADPITNDGYVPYTKVKFSVHAPGGELIKETRYDIGDETKPISQLLGLGYRRLEGQPDLASIDEEVLFQLENQSLNQELAREANEPVLAAEVASETVEPESVPYVSPKQELKASLARRVDEITRQSNQEAHYSVEESQPEPVKLDRPSSVEPFDYSTASASELSERAFQKVREFTQSPEALEEYMDFMSKFPQLSPRNVALIHEQWEGANAVATYDQWQALGKDLNLTPDDVYETTRIYKNKRTGEENEVVLKSLSVKADERAKITLFRPMMEEMIPVLDENGYHVKNDKGRPKYKKKSEATQQEKAWMKEGKIKPRFFHMRDAKTGKPLFTTYKVFELSQTTLKPESYPKAMPNRHYDFNTDKVKTKEVLEGLCDYAQGLGVTILQDDAHVLGNAKGAFIPAEQKILLNPGNLPGEKIGTLIHELAHATMHNPQQQTLYKEVPRGRMELEAEMSSYLVAKHFGLDTSEKAIGYMARWTDNLTKLDDKELGESMKRIHNTVSRIVGNVEKHTKPYQPNRGFSQNQNFSQPLPKGPKL